MLLIKQHIISSQNFLKDGVRVIMEYAAIRALQAFKIRKYPQLNTQLKYTKFKILLSRYRQLSMQLAFSYELLTILTQVTTQQAVTNTCKLTLSSYADHKNRLSASWLEHFEIFLPYQYGSKNPILMFFERHMNNGGLLWCC